MPSGPIRFRGTCAPVFIRSPEALSKKPRSITILYVQAFSSLLIVRVGLQETREQKRCRVYARAIR